MTTADVIVIGGGHNGLTAACYLARAGKRVCLLERREIPGGLAAREEFHPGFHSPGVLIDTDGLRPRVVSDLELERFGLELLTEEPAILASGADGAGFFLERDAQRTAAGLEAVSGADAAAWPRFCERIGRFQGFVERVLDEPPPDPKAASTSALLELLRTAVGLRRLGEEDMSELMRIAPMCVADWLDEWFETPLLKGALAGAAIEGTWLGPWSAGSAAQLLFRTCTRRRSVRGGPAALTDALLACARSAGVDLRFGAEVDRILFDPAVHVRGVRLTSGEELPARRVAATCEPSRALLDLVEPRDLVHPLEARARAWRVRGTTARVNLALDGPLEYRAAPGKPVERARLALAPDDLERAFDAVKYGEFSQAPQLEVWLPSLSNPDLAPDGKHVASILAHFAPYHLDGGWTDERRAELGRTVLATLEQHAPGAGKRIQASEILTPLDLEERHALTGGHIHHGEHALDQLLFMRPSPECARYATPLAGLFLCGSGSHPGGGISCGPGALGARALLESR